MTQFCPIPFHKYIAKEKAEIQSTYDASIRVIEEKLERESQYNLAIALQVELDYLTYTTRLTMYTTLIKLNLSLHRTDTLSVAINTIIDLCEKFFKGSLYKLNLNCTFIKNDHCYIQYINQKDNLIIALCVYLGKLETCIRKTVMKQVKAIEYVCVESEI